MNLTSNSTLHTVILPEGLTTIGNSAFAECTRLEYVNIPSTVTTLGRWMFENSTKVASV
ncbi:leucine-rich repeat domain-containing protein, partial [Dorea formicigenerans]|nr:leucine-rich repeat domain-containing protein [Dorea formicigenerans]